MYHVYIYINEYIYIYTIYKYGQIYNVCHIPTVFAWPTNREGKHFGRKAGEACFLNHTSDLYKYLTISQMY